MFERVLIAGAGGQGIVLMGRTLATAAVRSVPHVTFFPAYGAEVRGGVSNCQVVLSSREIASPVCGTFDSMIIMNRACAERYVPQQEPCFALLDSSAGHRTVPGAVVIDATRLADELGDTRVANFIMLGKYLSLKPVVPVPDVELAMRAALGEKSQALLDLNLAAFRAGLAHA